MRSAVLRNCFWKLRSFFNKNVNQQKSLNRHFTQETPIDYKPGTPEFKCVKTAIKNILGNLTHIPICIGVKNFNAKNFQYQCLPHNTRCRISQLSTANKRILNQLEPVAAEIRNEWRDVPIKERVRICNKLAHILAVENRHEVNASIMLGQSKTYRQAEEDTCRMINTLRSFSQFLSKYTDRECSDLSFSNNSGFNIRPSPGCVAALTPYNWTAHAVNLVLCPALMGNCVMWVPSIQSALSSYYLYLAMLKAGIPDGVINFVPINKKFLLHIGSDMAYLTGINFAGTTREYEELCYGMSNFLGRPNSFLRKPIVPVEYKNFHFVNDGANIDSVASETVRAAFEYNGQRGNSCENLYVPKALWCDLRDAIISEIEKLNVGDVCDAETTNSAVIDYRAYKRLVRMLKFAEEHEDYSIVCGGNYTNTHGYFVQPTVVECKTPHAKLMAKEIEGPIISVYAYEKDEIDDIIRHIECVGPLALAGSIFAGNDEEAYDLAEKFRRAAANIYINRACIGNTNGNILEMPDYNQEFIAQQSGLLQHW